MPLLFDVYQQPFWFIVALLMVGIWSLVWKGIGLWYAAKHQQRRWFITILIIDALGLLPIIYLLWFKPEEKEEPEETHITKKSVRKRKHTKA